MNIFPELKTEVDRWDVLVFGHLFWNRYFGETKENPPRGVPSTCSSVLVRGRQQDGSDYCLIVDPTTRHSPEEYYFDLNRRTGLKPEAITHCFVTHHHFDHWHGLKYFPNAEWLTGTGNKALIIEASNQMKASGREPGDGLSPEIDAERLREVAGEFLPGVYAIPLPGHTALLRGLAFRHDGKRILAAADGVMTSCHFKDRATEFQPDASMWPTAAATIENIAESFDLVVPGHDNLIVV
jgi:glyoxylase-like metal-dependent hydrolase (beta-lactamase superfamily II)